MNLPQEKLSSSITFVEERKVFVKPNEQSQACLNSAMARKRATKWNICVAIAILNDNNQVANNRYTRAITGKLLVCRLCIILLSLYELMVKIDIIHLTLFQLARCKQTIEQLSIESVRRIEIVALTSI